MSKTFVDCEGINVGAVHAKVPSPNLIGCYVTGTSDIIWTGADRAIWPDATFVTIDQGYRSPPETTAIVRDVEAGAWTPASAVVLGNWSDSVARKTIYCDQGDLPAVIAKGWTGDLWLAIPGWQEGDALPAHGKCTVVAVQNSDDVDNLYDSSIVLDAYWPANPPTEETMVFNIQVSDQAYVPFPNGTFKTATVYRDFESCGARIAVHSASKGYNQIWTGTTASAQPETITFTETDVDAVSISGVKNGPIGVTFA